MGGLTNIGKDLELGGHGLSGIFSCRAQEHYEKLQEG
jgi:hypothetical protein